MFRRFIQTIREGEGAFSETMYKTNVVYREPVTGPKSTRSRTGSCYDWMTRGTPTGLWARSLVGVNMGRKQSKWRRRSSD